MFPKFFNRSRAKPEDPPENRDAEPAAPGNGVTRVALANRHIKTIIREVVQGLVPILRKVDETLQHCLARRFDELIAGQDRQVEKNVSAIREQVETNVSQGLANAMPEIRQSFENSCHEGFLNLQQEQTARLERFQADLQQACEEQMRAASLRPVIEAVIRTHGRLNASGHRLMQSVEAEPSLRLNREARRIFEGYHEAHRTAMLELELLLDSVDVHPIRTSNDRFDPHLQQVVKTQTTTNPECDGLVAAVLSTGWMQGHRVIRPEQVIVYKMKENRHDQEE